MKHVIFAAALLVPMLAQAQAQAPAQPQPLDYARGMSRLLLEAQRREIEQQALVEQLQAKVTSDAAQIEALRKAAADAKTAPDSTAP